MMPEVVQYVRQGMSHLTHVIDGSHVIAVGKHGAPAAGVGSARDDAVDALGNRATKRFDSVRQSNLVVRFAQKVKMRALDAEVHDGKVGTRPYAAEGTAKTVINMPLAQITYAASDAQGNVLRLARIQGEAHFVALARASRIARPAPELVANLSPTDATALPVLVASQRKFELTRTPWGAWHSLLVPLEFAL